MKKKNTAGRRKSLARFFSYLSPYWGLFALGFAAMTLATIARLAGPLILRGLVDVAIPAKDTAAMIRYALLYLVIIVAMGGLTYYQTTTIVRLGLNVVTNIKRDLFSHLLTLPVAYYDKHPVGELMARVENDTEKVKQLFSETGIMLVGNVIYFLGMFAVFFAIDAKIATLIFLPSPLLLAGFFFVFDRLRPLYEKSRKKYAEITAIATEFVQGIEVVQAFNRTEHAALRLEAASAEKRDAEIKAGMMEYTTMGFMGFLGGPVLMVLIIRLVAPGVFSGALTVGTLLVFIEYGVRLFEPLFSIGENIRGMQQARVALSRIFDIMDLEPEPSGAGAIPSFEREIEFRDVSFEYKPGETVLDRVSFTICKGQTVALVGASGSGKTTTVSLLCRFYQASSGEILVDGTPLQDLALQEWRRKIGLVLQDIYLFPGTILENVRVYDEDLGPEAAMAALATVHATDFVSRLPEGMGTELHERGSNLSMGEKQLLSFARAVAFGAEIVIMDEATASVDVATERRIQESLEQLLEGRTALIVAHRLSSILKADRILFFQDGRIIAQGRHDELVAALPEYRELVRLQFPDLETETEGAL
ncbi:MAG: ABC transporter ATP-binding protein/permease [Spirochaetes bacterium]|nr:ABC transporter ATP-binding protein/permease [Spirochaetota bacterium]MBU1080548.1 ABC transporter ATP-binding protein/permease [Spirochaetota bacterium]